MILFIPNIRFKLRKLILSHKESNEHPNALNVFVFVAYYHYYISQVTSQGQTFVATFECIFSEKYSPTLTHLTPKSSPHWLKMEDTISCPLRLMCLTSCQV